MTKNKKKTAREKRVLIGALLVAATIAAGSTFAWFTSKDEVTNRLSASAKYDVAISENFQPPEEWVPGQEVNKDAGATNTGNIDAFVRMWLTGEMTVVSEAGGAEVQKLTDVKVATDANLAAINLVTAGDNTTTFYKKLSTTKTENPNNSNTNRDEGNESNSNESSGAYSEVQVMQAGGLLANAPDNAIYSYVTNQPTELTVLCNDGKERTVTVPANVTVRTINATSAASGVDTNTGLYTSGDVYVKAQSASASFVPVAVDAESFVPETEGLYIFARNNNMDSDDYKVKYEYSGYYFDGKDYYALKTDTNGSSDYTLPVDNITTTVTNGVLISAIPDTSKVKLYTASKEVLQYENLKWSYTEANGEGIAHLYALRDKDDDGQLDDDEIKIDIKLANITDASEGWTVIKTTTGSNDPNWTFYYNNDVESGDSTVKLVDSVTLDKDVTGKAYLAFDFDLDVHLESVQVTADENGNEQLTSVENWKATEGTAATGAKANKTVGDPEIETITWENL